MRWFAFRRWVAIRIFPEGHELYLQAVLEISMCLSKHEHCIIKALKRGKKK